VSALRRFQMRMEAEVQGRRLVGHASVFGQASFVKADGYYECMERGAFDGILSSKDTDVRALFNHNPDFLLGRQSSGTLRVSSDSTGLPFEIDLPNTQLGNDVRELAARGDLSGASIGFLPDQVEWSAAPDGLRMCTITSLQYLRDLGPVTFPQFSETSATLRSVTYGAPVESRRAQLVRARARARSNPERV
jgi:HK97 family phage prohead protease